MDRLKHYRIEIILKTGLISKDLGETFIKEDVNIIAQNEKRYCLGDEDYTTVEKKKRSYRTSINDYAIHSDVNDSCWGTRVVYSLYADKEKRNKTIKKEIALYLDKQYGAFSNIDLSFLDL